MYTNKPNILDSSATHHFTPITNTTVHNRQHISNGPTVRVATGETTTPKYTTTLPLHNKLSKNAKHTFVLDALPAQTLISLGQLCDDNCIAIFTKYDLQIIKEGQVLIQGKRNKTSGLWQINNQQQPETNNYKEQPETNNYKEHEAYGIINSRTTKQQLAKYHHACAFSPAISTWTKAIKKGHFATWPGLTEELVQKYYTPDDEISLGHMKAKKRSSNRAPQRSVSDPDPFLPDLEPWSMLKLLD